MELTKSWESRKLDDTWYIFSDGRDVSLVTRTILGRLLGQHLTGKGTTDAGAGTVGDGALE